MRQFFLSLLFICCSIAYLNAQVVEDNLASQIGRSMGTSPQNVGYWTRMATCTNNGAWEDFGTVFEILGTGSGDNQFFFGKLVARFKRQDAAPGPATNVSLFLMDSNIGTDNIRGVGNGATIDIYVRINTPYTRMNYRRIVGASSSIALLDGQPLVSELPQGTVISCEEWAKANNNFNVSGTNAPSLSVGNTDWANNAEAMVKAFYVFNGDAKERSARLELGTYDTKGSSYYGKVWSVESYSPNTWANSPEFRINNGNINRLAINHEGNVGIGESPVGNYKLNVAGNLRSRSSVIDNNEQHTELTSDIMGRCHEIVFGATRSKSVDWLDNSMVYTHNAGEYNGGAGAIRYVGNGGQLDFFISPQSTGVGQKVEWGIPKMTILRNGNVGIGKSPDASAKLDVAGTIRATEIKVEAQTADFVFDDNYTLRDLKEVESFITQHKHLPDIPSAAQMEADGVNLAEMNKLLLQKIEELTLYVIEKEKQVASLENETGLHKKQVQSMEKRLTLLESLILKE